MTTMKYIPILLALTACAVQPSTSTVDQSLCRLINGRCAPTMDPDDAQSIAESWVQTTYGNTYFGISIDCRPQWSINGSFQGYGCDVYFEVGGNWHGGGCTVWADGSWDCGEEDGE